MTVSTHTYTATLVLPSGTHPLGVASGVVTMDEGWAPHVQGSVTIAAPSSAVLALLDPRNDDARIRITAASDAGTGRMFDLSLRGRPFDLGQGDIGLSLASDEAQLQDDVLLASAPDTSALGHARSLRAIINHVVLSRYGTALTPAESDFTFATADPEALSWMPGVSAWDFLEPLVQTAALRLFCDAERRWHLVPATHVITDPVHLVYGQHLTGGTDSIDRDTDDWYDAVLFRYAWTDAFGLERTAYDWAALPSHSKTRVFDMARPFPGPGAAVYALDRARGRGHAVTLSAVSDYSVLPSRQLFLDMPEQPLQTGLIASVSFDLSTDEMSITSRGLADTPSTAWILARRGLRWADLPSGLAWTEYTH